MIDRGDVGPWAQVPAWLVARLAEGGSANRVSPGTALTVFCVIASQVIDHRTCEGEAKRSEIAAAADLALDTVDRAVQRLIDAEALEVDRRMTGGRWRESAYRVRFSHPAGRGDELDGRTCAAIRGAGDRAQADTQGRAQADSSSSPEIQEGGRLFSFGAASAPERRSPRGRAVEKKAAARPVVRCTGCGRLEVDCICGGVADPAEQVRAIRAQTGLNRSASAVESGHGPDGAGGADGAVRPVRPASPGRGRAAPVPDDQRAARTLAGDEPGDQPRIGGP